MVVRFKLHFLSYFQVYGAVGLAVVTQLFLGLCSSSDRWRLVPLDQPFPQAALIPYAPITTTYSVLWFQLTHECDLDKFFEETFYISYLCCETTPKFHGFKELFIASSGSERQLGSPAGHAWLPAAAAGSAGPRRLSGHLGSVPLSLWFWRHRKACRNLVPQPGAEPGPEPAPMAVKVPSPSHWLAREFPGSIAHKVVCRGLAALCSLHV